MAVDVEGERDVAADEPETPAAFPPCTAVVRTSAGCERAVPRPGRTTKVTASVAKRTRSAVATVDANEDAELNEDIALIWGEKPLTKKEIERLKRLKRGLVRNCFLSQRVWRLHLHS